MLRRVFTPLLLALSVLTFLFVCSAIFLFCAVGAFFFVSQRGFFFDEDLKQLVCYE